MDPERYSSNNDTEHNNPWLQEGLFDNVSYEHFAPAKIAETSTNSKVNRRLERIQKEGKWQALTNYINKMVNTEPRDYSSPEEFKEANPGYVEALHNMSYKDKNALRRYTGMDYIGINCISRYGWDYPKMGLYNQAKEEYYKEAIENVSEAINHAPTPSEDLVTHRGTNIRTFVGYDIGTISNLKKMQGQFLAEKGFLSTSLTKKHSYVNQDFSNTLHEECNIEVYYHIPAGAKGAAALLTSDVSQVLEQQEVVIDKDTLNYISEVTIVSPNHAIVDMIMIPKELDSPSKYDDIFNF